MTGEQEGQAASLLLRCYLIEVTLSVSWTTHVLGRVC